MSDVLDIAGTLMEAFSLQDDSDVARSMAGTQVTFACRWANLVFQVKRNRKDPPVTVRDFLWEDPPDYADIVPMHVRVVNHTPWIRIRGHSELTAWLSYVKSYMTHHPKLRVDDYLPNAIEGNEDVEF